MKWMTLTMAAFFTAAGFSGNAGAQSLEGLGSVGIKGVLGELKSSAREPGRLEIAGREPTEEEIRRAVEDFLNKPGAGQPGEMWKCAGKKDPMTREEMLRWIPGRQAMCRRAAGVVKSSFVPDRVNRIGSVGDITCKTSFKPDNAPREFKTRLRTVSRDARGLIVETVEDDGAGTGFLVDRAYSNGASAELIGESPDGTELRLFMDLEPDARIGWDEPGIFDAAITIGANELEYLKFGCRVSGL